MASAATRGDVVFSSGIEDARGSEARGRSARGRIFLGLGHPVGFGPQRVEVQHEPFATRDFVRAGQLLKIEVLDHVIIGAGNSSSLRSLGYFYA